MSTLALEPGWRERVYLFALDLEGSHAMHFVAADLTDAIGAPDMNRRHAQAFPVSDLAGVGLVDFLIEGMGISPRELDGERAMIDAIEGWVLVIDGLAFDERPAPLTVEAPLRLLGTYDKITAPDPSLTPPPRESARNTPKHSYTPPPDEGGLTRTNFIAFVSIVLAILVVAAFTGFL